VGRVVGASGASTYIYIEVKTLETRLSRQKMSKCLKIPLGKLLLPSI
jgi:hypothetical protein